jgi:YVTN family beta-propeller protein
MISQIMGLAFVVILLSNNGFAQTLHDRTLYEVVKQTPELNESAQIDVGNDPNAIAINYATNTVYVTNYGSDSISVINGSDNTKIGEDIPIGKDPQDIAINYATNTVYVANFVSNGVSVIDGATNKVVAGIMLNVNPFNSGYIECDRLISPTAQYFYILAG